MISTSNTLYSDIDLNFIPNPHTGDLVRKTNMAAIERAVKQALKLDKFDIPFDPTLRSSIKDYLFDSLTSTTKAAITADLNWLLKKVEPRINVQDITVSDLDERSLAVTITYMNASLNQIDTFSVVFSRQR
jgi:phage baseplate assembly protein W